MNISSSGLNVERARMDLISQNIANANTTRTEDGGPYKRQSLLIREGKGSFQNVLNDKLSGVEIEKVTEDNSDFKRVFKPNHPDADDDGYVLMPNVDVVTEMVNMISASRGYEANITAFNASKNMALKALSIGR